MLKDIDYLYFIVKDLAELVGYSYRNVSTVWSDFLSIKSISVVIVNLNRDKTTTVFCNKLSYFLNDGMYVHELIIRRWRQRKNHVSWLTFLVCAILSDRVSLNNEYMCRVPTIICAYINECQ